MPKSAYQEHKDTEVLAQAATQAALSANWQEAAKINQKILHTTADNIEALNRLARAYCCLGQFTKAQKTYRKVLDLDPYNIIARKNLDRISKTNGATITKGSGLSASPSASSQIPTVNVAKLFLFEPGKTKIISLLNVAPPTTLGLLNTGELVLINPKSHAVTITTQNGIYLGALPDDLAHKLIAFVGGGNIYEAYVKSATTKNLTILIRETYRSEKFTNQPSFQTNITSNYSEEQTEA